MKYMMPYTLPIAERGEGIRDEERRPTAYYKYVEVFTMKYMMPYTLPIAERGEGIRDEERGPTAYYSSR